MKKKYLQPAACLAFSILEDALLQAGLPGSGNEVPGEWDEDETTNPVEEV